MAKRLVDLYAIGAEVSFEDPDGGSPIVVYLKKLQPFEQEVAMNRANIQRAKVLTLKRLSQENEEILPYELQLDDNFNDEEIIDFISSEDVAKAYRSAEAKVSEEEQWAKEDYITGLQDSWEELKDHLHSDEYPEQHADAKRVFEELSKFSNEVDKLFNKEKARIIREYKAKTDAELRRTAIEKLIEMKADMKWLDEFRRSQIWLSTRENKDHNKKYFNSREEINEIHPNILQRLLEEYDEMSVKPEEGKD